MDSLFNIDFSFIWYQFFFPFLRILALIMVAPISGEKEVPTKVKIGLAVLITGLLPLPPLNEQLAVFSFVGVWVVGQQLVIGIAIGFTMQLAFMAIRFAGELIGMQMGLAMATFYDPIGGPSTSVLSRLFNIIALLLFLSFDGHLWLLYCLSESFNIIPIGSEPLKANGYLTFIEATSLIFINGLMLALPLITLLLIIYMSLGLLNKLTPQLSIFVVGFPSTLLLGLMMLSFLMPTVAPYCEYIFSLVFGKISDILLYFAH